MVARDKVLTVAVSVIIALLGFMAKDSYYSTKAIEKRLTIVEATLMNRSDAMTRLALLEHRVGKLEK